MSTQPISRTAEFRIAATLLAAAAFAACTTTVSVPAPAPAPAPTTVVVQQPAAAPADAPATTVYAVKSGSYEQWNPANPNEKTTVYFDDYGRKTTTYTVTTVGGRKTTTVRYNNNDGWVTTYVTGTKTATRVKYVADPAPSYFSHPVTDRKVIEVADIGGVKCEGWVVTDGGVDTKVWTYKGIPCKVEAGQKVVLQTTTIKEEAPTTTIFTIPADVTVKDN